MKLGRLNLSASISNNNSNTTTNDNTTVITNAEIIPGSIEVPGTIVADAPKIPGKVTRIKPTSVVYGKVSNPRAGASKQWNSPEFDFKEIARCLVSEAFFRRIVDKYIELIWRNGFKLVGKDPKSIKYIHNRFIQIQTVTQKPFNQLLREVSQQVVTYSNCFVEKVRNTRASGGRIRVTFYGKSLDPVAGYFTVDATSMQIAKDGNGVPVKYQQIINSANSIPEWNPEDMIHIYKDREVGLTFGTPMVVPVLDDIKALRRIEENVEMLIFNHAMPLFLYTAGDENNPPTEEDIEEAKYIVNNMPTEGMLVAPYYHQIQAIGSEGRALRCESYLEYFKNRVFAGLGTSEVALGYGGTASRSTAESVEKGMYNTVREFQNVIKIFLEESIIDELLLEGGFNTDDESKVEFFFPEIDIDDKIKQENHTINLYAGHLIGESEARMDIGRDPVDDKDRWQLYFNTVELPRAIVLAADEPVLTTVGMPKYVRKVFGNIGPNQLSTPKSSGTRGRIGQAKSLDMPSNQYGQKLAPGTTKDTILDMLDTNVLNTNVVDAITPQSRNLLEVLHMTTYSNTIENIYRLVQNDTIAIINKKYIDGYTVEDALVVDSLEIYDGSDMDMVIGLATTHILDKSIVFISNAFSMGVMNAGRQANVMNITMDTSLGRDYLMGKNVEWLTHIFNTISKSSVDIIKNSKETRDAISSIVTIFDSNLYRIRLGCRNEIQRSYNIGTFLGGIALGYTKFQLTNTPYDEDGICQLHNGITYEVDGDTSLDDIPPGYMTHPLCTCGIKLYK